MYDAANFFGDFKVGPLKVGYNDDEVFGKMRDRYLVFNIMERRLRFSIPTI